MIKFINNDRTFNYNRKTKLKAFIEMLFRKEKRKAGEIQYIFCTDEYVLEINKQFLEHDYYTDVITFDLGGSAQVDAEIYISVDRVKDNARQFSESFTREMLRVMIHGALHLCGYGDKTKREITRMRERENYYLRLFEIENPL